MMVCLYGITGALSTGLMRAHLKVGCRICYGGSMPESITDLTMQGA